MQPIIISKLILAAVSACSFGSVKQQAALPDTGKVQSQLAPANKSWKFEKKPVWADEFNGSGLPDSTKWSYDLGGHGWGNNELQNYTNSTHNVNRANGVLTITARKESSGSREYSSARIATKHKGDFLYGRFEIRAKIPGGRGTWPAIWMLPTDNAYGGWPKSGEIDIMEHVGYDPANIHITVHTEAYNGAKGTQKGQAKKIEEAFTKFHTYRVDWTPDAVRGYIDNKPVFEFINDGKGYASWPFNKRFHLLLNVAVGGNWGGVKGVDETVFPAAMEVDYVRVYKMVEK
ncbi:glycoside hydrolase family 16 protein [Mucilaginibacter sp. Bleaf8]|uniref:glycoside hydrolase family 16 protein n=1 Tax=Mucilaginibacter sp. Bleaf8 TaxID=2834430 RepID=UPI001BCB84A1|nr:glycoside hydrolase family 16 protein [Mucilaginibacter sp. Bleaf8]MBS7564425.1 glycoside hydrolase family 16 protein [Mucilaginibacter sp. Bleaf8]